jgi:hypothetical protein
MKALPVSLKLAPNTAIRSIVKFFPKDCDENIKDAINATIVVMVLMECSGFIIEFSIMRFTRDYNLYCMRLLKVLSQKAASGYLELT